MMIFSDLVQVLDGNADSNLCVVLPSGDVPAHFHVTEVGQFAKKFLDCGGTRRFRHVCYLQVWTADDVEHRLTAGKLLNVLKLADSIYDLSPLAVEVEYGSTATSLYALERIDLADGVLRLVLVGRPTECLAPDRCGVGSCC